MREMRLPDHSGSKLKASCPVRVRFSEVDSVRIAWHGSYAMYFEDAREEFGRRYALDYLTIFENGCYAPIVELDFRFVKPLLYGDTARVDIFYVETRSAKLVFDYEIRSGKNDELLAFGHSVQVFTDRDYQLMLCSPDFYVKWKEANGLLKSNQVNSR